MRTPVEYYLALFLIVEGGETGMMLLCWSILLAAILTVIYSKLEVYTCACDICTQYCVYSKLCFVWPLQYRGKSGLSTSTMAGCITGGAIGLRGEYIFYAI